MLCGERDADVPAGTTERGKEGVRARKRNNVPRLTDSVITLESVRMTEWNRSYMDSRVVGTEGSTAAANRTRSFVGAWRYRGRGAMWGASNTRAFGVATLRVRSALRSRSAVLRTVDRVICACVLACKRAYV